MYPLCQEKRLKGRSHWSPSFSMNSASITSLAICSQPLEMMNDLTNIGMHPQWEQWWAKLPCLYFSMFYFYSDSLQLRRLPVWHSIYTFYHKIMARNAQHSQRTGQPYSCAARTCCNFLAVRTISDSANLGQLITSFMRCFDDCEATSPNYSSGVFQGHMVAS